jgi:hypothetical protein
MTKQLKGKIHWVLDDFFYIGMVIPKTDDTAHIVARINNVIIAEHMIKLYVEPYEVRGELWSYNVNLLINESGTKFNGTFTEGTDTDWTGEVTCELLSNPKRHMLYGRWTEDEILFTFWAIIEKE